MREAERFEDMSPRGRLRVIQQEDGDMIVEVIEDLHSKSPTAGLSAAVEFCTSGGKSPKTREALRALMLAMAEENAERPHCLRRGERGLGVDQPVPRPDPALDALRPSSAPRAAATIDLAGHQYEATNLLRRALRNITPGRAGAAGVYWKKVRDAFDVGRTVACALCDWAGLDPDTGKDLPASEPALQKEGA